MTRLELLRLVVGRARANGFDLRRWYTHRLGLPWINQEAAIVLLETQRRYYALVFSHEFAQCFWKPGTDITFDVPEQTFRRSMPDGSVKTIRRKGFMRRSIRPNAWRYHLRQMAVADEPLRHLRKYLHVVEDLSADEETATPRLSPEIPGGSLAARGAPRPLPAELPAFLQRPYHPPGRPKSAVRGS